MNFKQLLLSFFFISITTIAQQIQIIDIQGGEHEAAIPTFIDNDNDGLADNLEQLLLEKFVPKFISIDDYCPYPGLDSNSIDSANIVICRIYPIFQQYINDFEINKIQNEPEPLVLEKKTSHGLDMDKQPHNNSWRYPLRSRLRFKWTCSRCRKLYNYLKIYRHR